MLCIWLRESSCVKSRELCMLMSWRGMPYCGGAWGLVDSGKLCPAAVLKHASTMLHGSVDGKH